MVKVLVSGLYGVERLYSSTRVFVWFKTNIFVPSLLKASPLGSPPIEVKVVSATVIDPISYGVLKDHLWIPFLAASTPSITPVPVPKRKITVPSELTITVSPLANEPDAVASSVGLADISAQDAALPFVVKNLSALPVWLGKASKLSSCVWILDVTPST